MHSAQELVSQIEMLTSLPDVYERIREQVDSPDGSIAEVASAVQQQSAATSEISATMQSASLSVTSIDKGIGADDRVIVNGMLRAVPGQKVDPQAAPAPSK